MCGNVSSILLNCMLAKYCSASGATACAVTLQGWSESVVVEPYQAAAECTEFSVTVIGTSKGPVALLPMEAEVFDYADDIFEADLEFEAYRARRGVCVSVWLDVLHSEGFWISCDYIEAS